MNSEKLNRVSFFYFMSVLSAGLLTVAVLFIGSQIEQWQSRQELVVYSDEALEPLMAAELKVFLAKTPYATMMETLSPEKPLSGVLDERAAVVVRQQPLTQAEREMLATAGIEVKESQVEHSGTSMYIITPAGSSRSVRKLGSFLNSKAARDIAGRRPQSGKAGKAS